MSDDALVTVLWVLLLLPLVFLPFTIAMVVTLWQDWRRKRHGDPKSGQIPMKPSLLAGHREDWLGNDEPPGFEDWGDGPTEFAAGIPGSPAASSGWRDEYYGEYHQSERARWAAIIAREGSWCSERFCVMTTRRIEIGAPFHLAHDHEAGGSRDYLGPAHPECNEHEARLRGVVFERDPDYPDR